MKALAVALMLVVSACGVTPAYAADKECVIATEAEFYQVMERRSPPPTMFVATPKALAITLGVINKGRLESGLWVIEADKLVIGRMAGGVGTVFFKDGCVVPGSVKMHTIETWATMMVIMGLTPKDFQELVTS